MKNGMELRMEEKVEFGLEGFWGWIEVVWIGWVFLGVFVS